MTKTLELTAEEIPEELSEVCPFLWKGSYVTDEDGGDLKYWCGFMNAYICPENQDYSKCSLKINNKINNNPIMGN